MRSRRAHPRIVATPNRTLRAKVPRFLLPLLFRSRFVDLFSAFSHVSGCNHEIARACAQRIRAHFA
jgi:hypothetical protein